MGLLLGSELIVAQVVFVSLDDLERGLIDNWRPQIALLSAKATIARVHDLDLRYGGFINEGSAVAVSPVCLKLGLRCLRHFDGVPRRGAL